MDEPTPRQFFKNNLTKWHLVSFEVLLVLFSVFTCLIVYTGSDDNAEHTTRVIKTTLGTITGPMTGAIARDFQSCCVDFSLSLMGFCAPLLTLTILAQFIRLPEKKWIAITRISLWITGWLIWFLGGVASFGHALS